MGKLYTFVHRWDTINIRSQKGFIEHLMNPHIIIVYCMIHQEVLVSKCLTHDLLKSMNQMISVTNYIKGNAFRSRIFMYV